MKVLDFESIKQYDYMANSLAFLALGDLEEAVISAYLHLDSDADSVKAKLDISLYIAKIYSRMGEYEASSNLLFHVLRYGIEEGRVYALLAYNFFKIGDRELATFYNLLIDKWNEGRDDILIVDREHDISRMDGVHNASIPRCADDTLLDRAWSFAKAGDTDRARCEAQKIADTSTIRGLKLELLLSLDIADRIDSSETGQLFDSIISSNIKDINVISIVYLLEKMGNYDHIARLLEVVISQKTCTAKLAYMYAVALNNIGDKERAIKILTRLSNIYGYVFPYIRTALYFIANKRYVDIMIYDDEDIISTLNLMRDSEICMRVLSKDEDFFDNEYIVAMIRTLYLDDKCNEIVTKVTSALAKMSEGRQLLKDVLLDDMVTSGKLKMQVARYLLDRESHLDVVYHGMVNSVDNVEDDSMTDKERSSHRDILAFNLISGS